jgi:cyclase
MHVSLLRLGLPAGFLTLIGVGAVLAPRVQEPSFTVHQVAGPISYLEGAGGNIGLLNGPGGFLLIDTQLAQAEQGVVGAIADYLGVKPDEAAGAPLYLLNTHWHGDHVGNNGVFGGAGVSIVAHENVRRRMTGAEGVEGNTGDAPAEALPSLTFEDQIALHIGGESIRVVHFPSAHTDGDSVVFFETSKVVHMGDLFFNGLFPFIDSGSGGSPTGYAAAIGSILEVVGDDWRIIPGHGPLASRDDLVRASAMLTTAIERVQAALDRGQSVEEMLEAGLLDDYKDAWGWRFIPAERFIADLAVGLGG